MTRTATRNELDTMYLIVKRAQGMGITIGTHTTQIMDIHNAHKQFNLRLDDFLAAPDFDFAHDFIGIQRNIDRITCRIGNLFVPRYAGQYT